MGIETVAGIESDKPRQGLPHIKEIMDHTVTVGEMGTIAENQPGELQSIRAGAASVVPSAEDIPADPYEKTEEIIDAGEEELRIPPVI